MRQRRNPTQIYLLKFNNRSNEKSSETSSELLIKTREQRRARFSILIIIFEYILHLSLLFLMLTLNK